MLRAKFRFLQSGWAGLVTILIVGVCLYLMLSNRLQYISAQPNQAVNAQEGGEDGSEVLLREQYWKNRLGNITAGDVAVGRQIVAKMPKARQLPAIPKRVGAGSQPNIALPPSGNWTLVGPAPISTGTKGNYAGRISALAVDPTTSGGSTMIYAGAANGGVWKSTNNGGQWIPLTDNQASLAIGAIAVDPNNHNTIYAGTGEANGSIDSYLGSGILKSTDGGATWTLQGSAFFGTRQSGNAISTIIVNPANSNQVFAATGRGLLITNDGGATWNLTSSGTVVDNYQIDDLVMDQRTNPLTLYVTVRGAGVFKSTTGGVSWTNITTAPLPTSSIWNRARLAIAPSNPNVLYLIVIDSNNEVWSSTYNGGFYTTNGGATWNTMFSLNQNFTGQQGWYDIALAVDPLNDDLVYGLGIDIAVSTDARGPAGNWQNISSVYGFDNSGIHPDQHAITFFPNCTASPCGFYAGNDGGIYATSNPTAGANAVTYTDLNTSGLAIAEYIGGDIGADFAASPLAIGGTQDNGTQLYRGAGYWPMVWGGDGGFSAIDRGSPNFMLGENYGISLIKSTDGGTNWQYATNGISGNTLFYMPYTMDRTNPNHVIVGTNSVWETLNLATSWGQSSQTFDSSISTLAMAPSNNAVIYVGLDNGELWKSTNANTATMATYTQLSTPSEPAGSGYPNQFWVDPADPNTVYLAMGRFYYGNYGYVFKTSDGGATWTNIGTTLPKMPVNTVVTYMSDSTRVIVVGCDLGVFFSTNEGASWTQLTAGLPNTAVNWLSVDTDTTTIVAFTHGRSAWALTIPQSAIQTSTPTFIPPSYTPTVTPPGGTCSAPAYDSTKIYVANDKVSYNGHLWQAKWWTQDETPSTGGSGVWVDLGSCSGGFTATPTLTSTATSTIQPSATGDLTATFTQTATQGSTPAWDGNYHSYSVGDLVSYNGHIYKCTQPHTSQPGWNPVAAVSLWLMIS